MKKIQLVSLFLLVIALGCSSCKKDSSSNKTTPDKDISYYVKLKLNGVQKQMTYHATTLFTTPASVYTCELTAQFAGNKAAGTTVVLHDAAAFTTGKNYTEKLITINNATNIQGTITFRDEDNTVYYATGTIANTSLTLQFTDLSANHVKGTFSGTFIKVGSKDPVTYVTITEGEFYLSRSL